MTEQNSSVPPNNASPGAGQPLAQGKGAAAALHLIDHRETDMMVLHTFDAWLLFNGRPADREGKRSAMPGGRRFAAVAKALWYLSANDNPYADWALVEISDRLAAIRNTLRVRTDAHFEDIQALRHRGLIYSMAMSENPKVVELGFASPYGYATAEALCEFDFYVRVVRTMTRKARISDEDASLQIREMSRAFRTLFLEPIHWERALSREALQALSRADFAETADIEGQERAALATAALGQLPGNILSGARQPPHSRRPRRASKAEIRRLQVDAASVVESLPEIDPDLI